MNKPEQYKDWLTLIESARAAGVTVNAVSYYIRHVRLDAVKIDRQWLINPASLKNIYPDVEV